MLKKITASRMILDEATQRKTGKEYTVVFDPEVGVTKILSICAIEENPSGTRVGEIDITLIEVQFNDVDAFIDTMFPWDDLDMEPWKDPAPNPDQFFNMAKSIVEKHAKSFRH